MNQKDDNDKWMDLLLNLAKENEKNENSQEEK